MKDFGYLVYSLLMVGLALGVLLAVPFAIVKLVAKLLGFE